MIVKLKSGSGIHIKKKNRGKFTAYCGGNVTSTCIAKAKASGNPTLVKRATFAANARKWKHQDGGNLIDKHQEGSKIKAVNGEAVKNNRSNRATAKGTISEMTVPKGYIEKSFPNKASDYMQKGLNKSKPMSDLQWEDPNFEDFGGYIDRITSLYKNGGMIRKMQTAAGGPITNAIDPMLIDYIKAIENPNRVGWDGKVWRAPNLKGYDPNLRGYGIDITTNKAARNLTKNRSGQWLTEQEADNLMRSHINYITDAANRHIRGFGQLSPQRQAALLGMLYRGDSVNKSGINIMDPSDTNFFNAVHNYYNSKGLKERASNSAKFFSSRQPKLIRRRR